MILADENKNNRRMSATKGWRNYINYIYAWNVRNPISMRTHEYFDNVDGPIKRSYHFLHHLLYLQITFNSFAIPYFIQKLIHLNKKSPTIIGVMLKPQFEWLQTQPSTKGKPQEVMSHLRNLFWLHFWSFRICRSAKLRRTADYPS